MIEPHKITTENPDGSMTLHLDPEKIAFVLLLDYDGDVVSRSTKGRDGISLAAILIGLRTAIHSMLHGSGEEL